MKQNIKIKSNTEGKILGIAGGNYRILISGEETNGNYAVIEMLVPPNGGPSPHSHPETQEMFYVVEGQFEFKTVGGKQIVDEGGFVNIPFGGAIHCFKNATDKVAKLLCTVVPAGLENYFNEIGQPTQLGQFLPIPELTSERIDFIKKIDEKYGQKTYPRDFLE
jgi:quercetin dioxygenase-like cupin family protein